MPYADRDTKRQYDLDRYYRLRTEFFSGRRCAICGGDDGLELHHLDPGTKESHRVWSWSRARREAELVKCTVLCRWCHTELHAETLRKSPRHGTTSSYRRGCRCDVCRKHHAARMSNYRHRKVAQEV
jgi:hypothetical protein